MCSDMTCSTALIGSLISACIPTWIIAHAQSFGSAFKTTGTLLLQADPASSKLSPSLGAACNKVAIDGTLCGIVVGSCGMKAPFVSSIGALEKNPAETRAAPEEDMLFMHGLHQVTCCLSFQIRRRGRTKCVHMGINASPHPQDALWAVKGFLALLLINHNVFIYLCLLFSPP